MKVLVISDVHANLVALEAVLDAEPAFDSVIFLGDAVDYGPDPSACLERIGSLRPARVRGNHDNAVAFGVDCGCSEAFREVSRATRAFTRAALDPAEVASLGAFPTALVTELGGARALLVHATPRDNLFEYTSPDGDPARWSAAMTSWPQSGPESGGTPGGASSGRGSGPARGPVDVILVGHTHQPYLRRLGKLVVVNPGSVGQPRDGDPRASYAVWDDGRFALKRVSYDISAAVARLFRAGLPPAAAVRLAGVLQRGR